MISYMEVVLIIIVVALIAESVVSRFIAHKERLEMAKIYKAKDVKEMDYMLFPESKIPQAEQAFEDNPNVVPLDKIPEEDLIN